MIQPAIIIGTGLATIGLTCHTGYLSDITLGYNQISLGVVYTADCWSYDFSSLLTNIQSMTPSLNSYSFNTPFTIQEFPSIRMPMCYNKFGSGLYQVCSLNPDSGNYLLDSLNKNSLSQHPVKFNPDRELYIAWLKFWFVFRHLLILALPLFYGAFRGVNLFFMENFIAYIFSYCLHRLVWSVLNIVVSVWCYLEIVYFVGCYRFASLLIMSNAFQRIAVFYTMAYYNYNVLSYLLWFWHRIPITRVREVQPVTSHNNIHTVLGLRIAGYIQVRPDMVVPTTVNTVHIFSLIPQGSNILELIISALSITILGIFEVIYSGAHLGDTYLYIPDLRVILESHLLVFHDLRIPTFLGNYWVHDTSVDLILRLFEGLYYTMLEEYEYTFMHLGVVFERILWFLIHVYNLHLARE